MKKGCKVFLSLWFLGFFCQEQARAEGLAEPVSMDARCGSRSMLVVLAGSELPALIGTAISEISLYKATASGLLPISYQIDSRDEDNRYLLDTENPSADKSDDVVFDANDELVLLARDFAHQLDAGSEYRNQDNLIEIQFVDSLSGRNGWVYFIRNTNRTTNDTPALDKHISYDADLDMVETDIYRIGFSKAVPFLIDRLRWGIQNSRWSPNTIDTMKIQHRGKMLGLFQFKRTADDYHSKLVVVKTGPLRIIRRTENKVRLFWKLKSPKVYIDYVMEPDGFVMDTIIDIPFKIGLFFSGLETLSTIDMDNNPDIPPMKIKALDSKDELLIDGSMTELKNAFNESSAEGFVINSQLGSMKVILHIPDTLPIKRWLYLVDDSEQPDPPERIEGQFGNVGFRTTDWEKIDAREHHLKFNVCMSR
jgi:hypothetical protein